MSDAPSAASFGAAYAEALDAYLANPSEASLRVAYELGREAVRRRLSVLDLAEIHREALAAALAQSSDAGRLRRLVAAAGDFLLESLASFEMVQRGLGEVRQAILGERRRIVLSRRLSSFLADASLALESPGSREEMLQLVAEQARELVGAECCLVTLTGPGRPRIAEAVSHPDGERRWEPFVRWLDLDAIYRHLRESGGSARHAGEALSRLELFRSAAGEPPLRGWLTASLTALDGSEVGAVQLFDKEDGEFAADDEAALVHLAQTASAAVERVRIYEESRD